MSKTKLMLKQQNQVNWVLYEISWDKNINRNENKTENIFDNHLSNDLKMNRDQNESIDHLFAMNK